MSVGEEEATLVLGCTSHGTVLLEGGDLVAIFSSSDLPYSPRKHSVAMTFLQAAAAGADMVESVVTATAARRHASRDLNCTCMCAYADLSSLADLPEQARLYSTCVYCEWRALLEVDDR